MADSNSSRPYTRLDLAQRLKKNKFDVTKSVNELLGVQDLEDGMRDSISCQFRRVHNQLKKCHKPIELLCDDEWWNHEIPWKPNPMMSMTNLDPVENVITLVPKTTRKNILTLTFKQQRTRLESVLQCVKLVADIEATSPVTISSLVLQLLANEVHDTDTATFAKTVAYGGNFGKEIVKEIPVNKSLFVLDQFELGRRKYTQLRQLMLPCGVEFPAYNKLVDFRDSVILRPHIRIYPDHSEPIGVCTSYISFVQQTAERLLSMISPLPVEDFPITFKIADGLDGSGSHTTYNQQLSHPSTKNFILFCFKPISITTHSGQVLWKNSTPNSPFSQRPVFLCAATECEKNVRIFMDEIINEDTEIMAKNGIDLTSGCHINVDIIRSMFDGKMSALLSGAGGASCQLCTATHKDLKDRELITQGFPINRKISDAIDMFGEMEDIESFFTLPSNERFNLTHQPISTIDINSASPLHSYTCVFRWYNLVIYHLSSKTTEWSPTSARIKSSMRFVRAIIQEQTGLKVDQPDSRGGTSSTGNVARKAFSDKCKYLECVLSLVDVQHRAALSRIHAQLGATLRILNSDRKINTNELGNMCRATYLLILESFPWVSITPSLHKLLAHSEELIRDCNSGYGLKCFSEERLESCNKLVRRFRENLSRKNSFESNIMDIFVRLSSESDPALLSFRKVLVCERCGESGHIKKTCCSMQDEYTSETGIDGLIYSLMTKL